MVNKRWKIGDNILLKNGEKTYIRASIANSVEGYYYLQGNIFKSDGKEDSIEFYCTEIKKTGEKVWAKPSNFFEIPIPENYICLQNRKRKSQSIPEILTKKEVSISIENIENTTSQHDSGIIESSVIEDTLPKKPHIRINVFEEFMTLGRLRLEENLFSDRNDIREDVMDNSQSDISPIVPYTSTEIDRYLKRCWTYTKMKNIIPNETKVGSFCGWKRGSADSTNQLQINAPWVTKIVDAPSSYTAKTNWCYVCGKRKSLTVCESCPAAFHKACISSLLQSKKRRNGSELRSSQKSICPHCSSNNPIVFEDIVWDKMKTFPWWPARVLTPTEQPKCLKLMPTPYHVPIQYFGKVQYAWADSRNLLRFLPTHTIILKENGRQKEKEAVTEALAHYK